MSETLDPVVPELDQRQLTEQLLAQAKEQGVERVGPNGERPQAAFSRHHPPRPINWRSPRRRYGRGEKACGVSRSTVGVEDHATNRVLSAATYLGGRLDRIASQLGVRVIRHRAHQPTSPAQVDHRSRITCRMPRPGGGSRSSITARHTTGRARSNTCRSHGRPRPWYRCAPPD
jgi:hypothetical protein